MAAGLSLLALRPAAAQTCAGGTPTSTDQASEDARQ